MVEDEGRELVSPQPRLAVSVANVHVQYEVTESVPSVGAGGRLGFRRHRSRVVQAIDGVSFSIFEGESVGLIGSNGSGKSTILRAIAGLVPITEGEILVSSLPVLLGVGAVMDRKLSGRDNILIGGLAMGMSAREAKDNTRQIARFAGVGKFIDVPMRAYSSGMRSRLQFSIATTTRPEILIVDEALATGDRDFKRKAVKRLRRMLDDDGTLLFVSHNDQQVRRICSRVIWLDAGKVVMDGPADEVVAAYESFGDSVDGEGGGPGEADDPGLDEP